MKSSGGTRNFVANLPTLVFDASVIGFAFFLALNFAFARGFGLATLQHPGLEIVYSLVFGLIGGVIVYATGLFRGLWRYTSLADCLAIVRVMTVTLAIFVPAMFLTTRGQEIPRSAPIIAWFLGVTLLAGPRILMRAWADGTMPVPFSTRRLVSDLSTIPILVAGKPERIEPFVRELQKSLDPTYNVIGILTDEAGWHGRTMHGVGVLGRPAGIDAAMAFLNQRKLQPQRLIIADDSANEAQISNYLDLATRHGLTLGRLPRLTDFTGTRGNEVQPIELADLLGRPQIPSNREALIELIRGRRVLITGGGGSIGSELARQISDLKPRKIILLENSEFNLYSIDQELQSRHPRLARVAAYCDVRDRHSLNHWFSEHKPDIVFHAAALKHVPIVEAQPIEGMRTNMFGTQNVAEACIQHDVPAMVLISTDKAVNPHNVMGASKRCAEAYCQALDARAERTKFTTVRFGNVLGSAGSVVPLFQRQLASGGPLTVTDPEISRYFMTIPEAVTLVLQSSALNTQQQKRGSIYVLDMGEPVKIADLARQVIRLSGKIPEVDVAIEYIGLRPGEKLYEEVVHQLEAVEESGVAGVKVIKPRTSEYEILRNQFAELSRAAETLDLEKCLRILRLIVPEFQDGRLRNVSLPDSNKVVV